MFEIREERLILLLKDLSQEELPFKAIELQKESSLYQQELPTEISLDIAAETIQDETKSCKSNLNWPPEIKNLEQDQVYLPM